MSTLNVINPVSELTVAGLDLGNGYVKALINGVSRVYPSIVVKQFNPDRPPIAHSEIPSFMENIINEMDLSFSSPLVKATERRLFGERALKSGLTFEEFDVFAHIGKSEVDLSGVLGLGTIAADALSSYFMKTKTLPADGSVRIRVDLASALPIDEHKKHATRYKNLYLNDGKPHIVTFHNFMNPVRVEIIFDNVAVFNEGESAQYGLMFANKDVQDLILQLAKKQFPDGALEGMTGRDIINASDKLCIDIGEGTIDWAIFTKNKFNPDVSSTFKQGYGAVLEATLSVLQDEGYSYTSRKQLSEFLHSKPTGLNMGKYNKVKAINEKQEDRFALSISGEVSKVFSRIAENQVIFVFGGGASPLEWTLMPKLKQRVAEYGKDNMIPIIYLDSRFSRFLNVHGLYQVAMRLRGKPAAAQAAN